jgi:hypothetical protein
MENKPEQQFELMPQPTFDISQFAPLVAEFQKGEIEKIRINRDADKSVAQMNIERQKEIDRNIAQREVRQDKFDSTTTALLYAVCVGMMAYGMWYRDPGFITAGVSGFGSYLAGMRTGRGTVKPRN